MPGLENSASIRRSIEILSQDIDILGYTLRASPKKDVDSYRQSGLIDAMKRQRSALRSQLLISQLLPSMRRQ